MALLFEYFAKQFGEKTITELYNFQKYHSDYSVKGPYDCIDLYVEKHCPYFFTFTDYHQFLVSAVLGELKKGISYGNMAYSKIIDITHDGSYPVEGDLFRYGVRVQSYRLPDLYKNPQGEHTLKGKELRFSEAKEGVFTDVYSIGAGTESGTFLPHYLGQVSFLQPLVITDDAVLDDLLQKNTNDPTKKKKTIVVISYNSTNSKTLPSQLIVTVGDPLPQLSLSKTESSFTADGGEEKITVTTNCTDVSVTEKPTWCSASISGNTLTLKAEKNTTTEKREGNVVVKARNATGEVADTVKVTQEGKAKTNNTVSYSAAYFIIRLKNLPPEIKTMNLGVSDVFYLTCPYSYSSEQVSDTIWAGGTSSTFDNITYFTTSGTMAPFPYRSVEYWSESWNMNIEVDQDENVASGTINQRFTRDFYAQDPLKYDVGSIHTVTYTINLNLQNVPNVGIATIGNYDYWTNHNGVNKDAYYFLIDGASTDSKDHVNGTVTLSGYSYPTTNEVVINIKDVDIDYVKLYLIP